MAAPAPTGPPAPPPGAPPAPATVTVRAPDGGIYDVPSSELAQLPEGSTIATRGDIQEHDLQQKYGGAGGMAAAAGLGLASGATMGISNAAVAHMGGREYLAGVRNANPWVFGGTELAGAILPSAFTGGEAEAATAGRIAARGVSAPARAVAGLGGLAERGAAGLLGREAESFAGRAVQQGVKSAARGAVEGAAYGAAQGLSDGVIDDPDHVAEHVLAGVKGGALFGALTGGALGIGGEALSTGAKSAQKAIGKVLAGEGEAGASSLQKWIRQAAEDQGFEAMGARAKDYARLGESGRREVSRTLLDEGITAAGRSKGEMAERLVKRTDEVGEKLKAMSAKLDGAEARFNTSIFASRVRQEVLAPMQEAGAVAAAPEATRIGRALDDFAGKIGDAPTFAQMKDAQAILDKELGILGRDKAGKFLARQPEIAKVREIMGQELNAAANRASSQLGSGFNSEYQATKKLYANLAEAKGIVLPAAARQAGAPAIGLGDRISGLGGAVLGFMSGGVVGGAMGLLGGAANKYLREHGNSIAADLLNRASTVQTLQRGAQATESKVASGVRAFLTGTKAAGEAVGGAAKQGIYRSLQTDSNGSTPRARFDHVRDQVTSLAQNPEQHAARIGGGITRVAQEAPSVATAMTVTSVRAAQFLASKAPPAPSPPTILAPQQERPKAKSLGPDELRFLRYADAVEDPIKALDGLKDGTLSMEAVEAIRTVYPKLYLGVRNSVFEEIANMTKEGKPLPEDKAIRLGKLLDLPTHFTLDPDFIAAVQATKESPAPEEPPQGAKPPNEPTAKMLQDSIQTMQTPSEDIQKQ